MKKVYSMILVLVLVALLFAGCRDTGSTTPSTTNPATSAATQPTILPSPDMTLPIDTTPTTGSPSARGPRY